MKVYRAVGSMNTVDDATILAVVRLSNVRYDRVFVAEWAVSSSEVREMRNGRFLRHHGIKYIKLPTRGELYINDHVEGYFVSIYKTKDTGAYVCIEIYNESYKDMRFCYKYMGEV